MLISGTPVSYKDHQGVINFVSQKYVTITISYGQHRSQDCNIIVYRSEFPLIYQTNTK